MRTAVRPASPILLVFAVFAIVKAQSAQAQISRYDELANLPFVNNRPTPETAKILSNELMFQRATQTYLWAVPLINTLGMKVGSEKTFGAGYNVLSIWKKRLDAKTLVTTPNSDVIYAMSYVDLGKDGPLLERAPNPGLITDAICKKETYAIHTDSSHPRQGDRFGCCSACSVHNVDLRAAAGMPAGLGLRHHYH